MKSASCSLLNVTWSPLPYLGDISYFYLLGGILAILRDRGTLSFQCVKGLGSDGSDHLASEYSPASFSAVLVNDKVLHFLFCFYIYELMVFLHNKVQPSLFD